MISKLLAQKNIQKFEYKQRPNFILEIIRLFSLLLVVMHHINYISPSTHFEPFMNFLHNTALAIDVWPFLIITSFYSVGKGKEYFLRTLSRFLFVIVIVAAITLPMHFAGILMVETSWDKMTLHHTLTGGRSDIWYLYAFVIAIFVLPFIKLDNLLNAKFGKLFSLIVMILILICFEIIQINIFQPLLNAIKFILLGIAFSIAYSLMLSWNWKFKNKSVMIIGIAAVVTNIILWQFDFPKLYIIPNLILILAASTFKVKTPKWFSWIVHHTYFLYEFHFLFQVLFFQIVKNYSTEFITNNTLSGEWLWYEYVFVICLASLLSIVLVKIQKHFWEPYIAKNTIYLANKNIVIYGSLFFVVVILSVLWFLVCFKFKFESANAFFLVSTRFGNF